MLIVIEGMDGTGKTTLANKIIKEFPQFEYKKPVPSKGPEGQTAHYMLLWMNNHFKEVKEGASYIMDRINLISEEVYGPICRNGSKLGQEGAIQAASVSCMGRFLSLDPIIVFCRPDNETILANIDKEFQMSGVHKYAPNLIKAYDAFFVAWEAAGVPVIHYDYIKDPDGHEIIKLIKLRVEYAPHPFLDHGDC